MRLIFGCGLALLPSLALYVGLHLDLGLCCGWSETKGIINVLRVQMVMKFIFDLRHSVRSSEKTDVDPR